MQNSPIDNRIGSVFVPVSDMRTAIEWYSDLFDLPIDESSHEGTIYDLEMAGDVTLTLDSNRPVENSSQPLCYFWTDDVEVTDDFLRERGISVVMGPENVGSVTFVTFEDPDGNRLMACQAN
ncbi:VOC family protein [Haladaptatus caseinilyticus]|uniref:VOC family protein n=1 Tax=Haladaptatus caseinilyticus TaxID=2993314 RepID=UPI00224AFD3A|nr:VOC family protein [Haladaptatus caseinilyticus]